MQRAGSIRADECVGEFHKTDCIFFGRYVPTANQVFFVYRIMKYERDLRDSVSQRFLMS